MDAKKIANKDHRDLGTLTTRSVNQSGLGRYLRRAKRLRNRAAIRKAERFALREQTRDIA